MSRTYFRLLLVMVMPAIQLIAGTPPRESVTFLLGEDRPGAVPLFSLAEACFRQDPIDRTNHLRTSVRSLRELCESLRKVPPGNGQPWGVVNLVVHGNRSGDPDLALEPNGPLLTVSSLRQALERGFEALPDGLLDAQSEIRIHGCSIGRNRELLAILSRALGGEDHERPLVRATPWFTSFQTRAGGIPRRTLCQHREVIFPTSRRPSRPDLVRRFRATLGLDEPAILGALERSAPRFPGDAYSYEDSVRYTWTVAYQGGAPPTLPGTGGEFRWLISQETLHRGLSRHGLALGELDWRVHRTQSSVNGTDLPALRAEGQGRVVRLLRTFKDNGPGPPPEHAWEDQSYFTSAR